MCWVGVRSGREGEKGEGMGIFESEGADASIENGGLRAVLHDGR